MTTNQESVIDQFSRQAVHYPLMPGHNNEESLRLLMNLVHVSEQDTALDVACGSGIVACAFATVASHVTGIDLTPAMLEQARSLARQRGLTNLSWQQGDIERLPFPDNSFSIVLSRYAFHHFLNPAFVLSEMVRVCRFGGQILVADAFLPLEKIDAYNYFEKLFDPSHARALTLEEFQSLVANAGLQNVRLAFYKMEMELEQHLAASYPNEGDEDKIRQLLTEDLGINRLGIDVHLLGDEIRYAYPVTVVVGEKPDL